MLTLTPSQSLLWIDGQLHPEAPINNMVTRLDIRQAIDVDAFQTAFAALVEQHEAMRLVVSNNGEQFVASVTGDSHPRVPFIDYSKEANAEQQFHAWIQQRCRRVFGLNERLYDAALIKLGEQHFVFFMNQHHCVTDGRSCQVMLSALDQYYAEQVTTGCVAPHVKDDASRSFTEYLLSRADYLGSEQAQTSEAFWTERYRDAPEPVKFYGRSSDIKNVTAQRHARVLPAALAGKILAGKKETPPSIVFATVLFAFLRRTTGNSDLCIGVPLLNRAPDFASTLGLFMEISRNRLSVTADDSFATLLQKIRAEAASIKPHRSHTITSRNGRFEAMLNYRMPADTRFGGQPAILQRIPPIALLDTIPSDEEPSDYWAGRNSLEVDITHTPASSEFYVALDFNTGVWPDPQARERSLEHFIRLLEHYFDNHSASIDSLDILSGAERQLLQSWNDTSAEFSLEPGIHQLFEAQAARTPAAIALEYGNEQLSYQQLNSRANRLAHALIREGLGAERLVGISLKRSMDLVVTLLATLKAGAAYVPLDPTYPEKRRQLVIDEAAPDLLLTEQTLAELRQTQERSEDDHNPDQVCPPSTLAYVIFTSGSTGRPKGIMIEQGALVNFIQAAQQVLQLTDKHRLLSVTTVSFDIFALELFLPMAYGARVVLAGNEAVLDGRLLAQDINSRGVTHLQATPATWHMLLAANWQPIHPLSALVGGELLTTDLAERLAPYCLQLRNWYGPSEATVWATQLLVQDTYQAGDVGQPLANYSVHILDAGQKPTPIGVTGEICIGGNSLARGYMNRDDLTAATFTQVDGLGRLYRTGDLGRWTTEGHIEFLGRSDFQVKVRGFRIELGDIEAALLTHPAVTEATVAVFGDAENKQLAAYVTLDLQQEDASVQAVELAEPLRTHLKQLLPHYMLPSSITVLQRLPLTPNGKIDRKALPNPDPVTGALTNSYCPPGTPLQETVAAIWAEVLGLERVGIRDNFFDLGGHSLMAMRLVTKIENATGMRLRLPEFFQGLTIEEICDTAAAGSKEQVGTALSAIRAQGSRTPFFAIGSHPRYTDAVQRVAPEQPVYRLDVYALQSERMDRGLKPLPSIEEITSEFIDAIQSVQPGGPYYIGGGCEGAMIGFAVAAELQRRGEEVAQLILWITPAPGYSRGRAFGLPAYRRMSQQLKALYRHLSIADLNTRTLREVIQHEYIEYRIFRAMDQFQPTRPFQGQIVLARTAESRGSWDTDRTLGWGGFASGGVQVHDLPGNHDTWLVDHAEVFGDLLDACLRQP